jgi:predicted RNA-binding Zn-ribbon protein involved in translation (DUF1610 family)
MGILDTVVGRFKTEAPDRPYECLQCGVHLDVEYYICPNCGSFSIDRRSMAL